MFLLFEITLVRKNYAIINVKWQSFEQRTTGTINLFIAYQPRPSAFLQHLLLANNGEGFVVAFS